jgi:hypothetical protein
MFKAVLHTEVDRVTVMVAGKVDIQARLGIIGCGFSVGVIVVAGVLVIVRVVVIAGVTVVAPMVVPTGVMVVV